MRLGLFVCSYPPAVMVVFSALPVAWQNFPRRALGDALLGVDGAPLQASALGLGDGRGSTY